MDEQGLRQSGQWSRGPGRLGEGRVYADIYRHGTNPRSTRKYFRVSPSERTFSAPYIVTVMRGVQLCTGSSRYSCRSSGLVPRQYPSARDGTINGSGQRSEACTDRSPIELTGSVRARFGGNPHPAARSKIDWKVAAFEY